jgi:hypothetical protein
MTVGEDVDLVWRLVSAGWEVRYEPSVEVEHHPELRPVPWAARRAAYGSSAGPLARRHGDAVAPVRLSPVAAAAWGLAAGRRPLAALGVVGASGLLLGGRLRGVVDRSFEVAARLSAVGLARSAVPAVAGVTRVWGPLLVVSLLSRRLGRFRLVALGALGLSATRDWRSRPHTLDPLRYVATRATDDLAYGAGVWWGCWRARTLRPLVPAVVGRRTTPPPSRRAGTD